MSLVNVDRLCEIAEVEFAKIVTEAFSPNLNEVRIILVDGSFVDLWFSLKLEGRYSYHWERQLSMTLSIATTTHLISDGNLW